MIPKMGTGFRIRSCARKYDEHAGHPGDLQRLPRRPRGRIRSLVPGRASASSGSRCPASCIGRRHAGDFRQQPAISISIVVESPAVLTSQPYLERLDNPTPMTRKVMSEIFLNMNRTVCHRTLRRGGFRGAYAVTVRFNEVPDIGGLTRLSRRVGARPRHRRLRNLDGGRSRRPAGVDGRKAARRRQEDQSLLDGRYAAPRRRRKTRRAVRERFRKRRGRRISRAVPVGKRRNLNDAIAAADRGKNRRRV